MELLVLRIAMGVIFLWHGYKKIPMWKMQPSDQMPANMLSIMKILAIAESLGGAAILIGFLTRLASIGIGIIMLGAIYFKTSKWKRKFDGDGGWEFDLILLAAAITLVIAGAGSFSIDGLIV